MAETSYLWDNPGTGDSPAGGYDNATFCQVIWRMLFNGTGNQGALLGWLNNLAVTDGGGLNAAVDTGGAFCYGVWFENDAAVNVALAPNAAQTVIVRASWATQTARLAATSVALVQNPGVTYEIPLATLTTGPAAIIVGPTDARDYCEFTTVPWPFGVSETMIANNAVTVGKLANQDRWLDLGHGAIEPDVANPCAWTNLAIDYLYRDKWDFVDGVVNAGWLTFIVPADLEAGANIELHIRTNRRNLAGTGDVRWCYSAFTATPGGVIANVAACTTITYQYGGPAPYNYWQTNMDVTIATLAGLAAGDIVHVEIYRDGGAGADNLLETVFLHLVRAEYTADS